MSIQTFGEIDSEFLIELVGGDAANARLKLLYWDGHQAYVDSSVSVRSQGALERHLLPADLDPSIRQAIYFPATVAPYETLNGLHGELASLIQHYTRLRDEPAALSAHWLLSTWLSDCLPAPVGADIVGPWSAQGSQLFRLLHALCRRAVSLAELSLSRLCALPMQLCPTIFVDQPSPQTAKALRVLRSGRSQLPWKKGLATLHSATLIRRGGGLSYNVVCGPAIEIAATPACRELPVLDRIKLQEITEKFQPMLLTYRLCTYKKTLGANFDIPHFCFPLRELGCSLGACMTENSALQAQLVKLLEPDNALAEPDPESVLNAVVIEALLKFCHQRKKDRVYVGDITSMANEILNQGGETLQMEPRSVGHKLKLQGLATKQIGPAGRGLTLLEAVRRQIHKLAWELQIFVNHPPSVSCDYCLNLAKTEVVDVMF